MYPHNNYTRGNFNSLNLNASYNQTDLVIKQNEGNEKVKSYCINVDSRDRNVSLYPLANKFEVNFRNSNGGCFINERIKNVVSIQLVEAIIPTDAMGRYATLKLSNFDNNLYGSNDVLNAAFSVLITDYSYSSYTVCKLKNLCNCFKKFSPPLAELTSFKLELYKPDGDLADTGTDVNLDETVQTFFTFEIKTLENGDSKLNNHMLV